ncbi:hydroxymethylbilane synthase [Corynebacterium liangguodongii]|uniref:Porphobilinogen deaminase n=1 Tax=Corynebacterium liangguodongii TaxID=2079535 RepID=A0A2S0WBZ8_9CORY|nr:hydroxymethylbilane synthase [Corynebacterium liangguodongii]AWB83286.1 hydroxymethylbilane synthase [Corynebacterium liangguodongii]PWC00624.1 hydroxymethylbilane synthase [Corynebacterium liangguodongii]
MLTIGTRGSHLARTQAGHVRDALIANGHDAELRTVTTPGDISQAPVERIGVGVFTSALRDALFAGEVEVAVHSFKDLPTADEPRAHIVVPPREDNREALIARDGMGLADLPAGARVGTSAPRRVAQLKALRPDLDIRPLRGNIDSRLGRVESGELDAIVLAYAGLSRGGYGDRATQLFDVTELMPAPAQGALAVECRVDDAPTRAALDELFDATTALRVSAERQVLASLEAGCTAPVAAHAELNGGRLALTAGVFALDGSRQLVESAEADIAGDACLEQARSLGREIAGRLLEEGAARLMG